MKKSVIILFLVLIHFKESKAQILYDKPTLDYVLQTLDKIYNYEFAEVDPMIKQIGIKYANHPVIPLLKALKLQWQYLPVKDNKVMLGQYFSLLQETINKAQILEKNPSTLPEAEFFLMSAHGYVALVHNFNDESLKAAGEARKAYGYVMKGFELMSSNFEFYLSTGMYNYYIEQYPEEHPIVRPLLIFFKDGSKELGLKQMDIATKKGVFSRTEAAYFLARIYLKHEMKFGLAASYLQGLVEKYPQNPIYVIKYIEALILSGKYEIANIQVNKIRNNKSKIMELSTNVFDGMILEKEDKNDVAAENKYLLALKIPFDDEFTKEYHAFAYCGLARIYIRKNDRKKAKFYYKKASELAKYTHVVKEIKGFK